MGAGAALGAAGPGAEGGSVSTGCGDPVFAGAAGGAGVAAVGEGAGGDVLGAAELALAGTGSAPASGEMRINEANAVTDASDVRRRKEWADDRM